MIVIDSNGNGDFPSINAALAAAPDGPVTLALAPGVYRERVTVTRPGVTLLGAPEGGTVLTGALFARMPRADYGKLGTFRSYSCLVQADDFTARHITFENTAGKGPDVGQALALYADGDHLAFEDCRFLGGQDTLFTAPLPPKEVEPNGFVGPGLSRPRKPGRHYYKNCYFEGDIDFVFGGACAYFERCEFHAKDIGKPVNSYVTAASTPRGQEYGYVMDHCRFTGSCPPHSAFLGRPWREHARVVLLHCEIGECFREEGWHDWGKTDAHKTVYFAEYKNRGASADMNRRPGWVHELTDAEALHYTKELVLHGKDGWNP